MWPHLWQDTKRLLAHHLIFDHANNCRQRAAAARKLGDMTTDTGHHNTTKFKKGRGAAVKQPR